MWFSILIGMLASYLLGNLNGAVCMSALHHDDVRSHGSGNAGLTNFIRNYGVGQAIYVILIDAGKAALACLLTGLLLAPYGLYTEGTALGGLAVMLGHVFPALLGFKGGKGILSGLFIALVVDWRIAVIILIVFAAAYLLTQYVSLGSVLAATAFAVSFVLLHLDNLTVALSGAAMGMLAVFMHRGNIVRLIKGEERKTNLFGKGKKS
ncbi:MAG: glycerol-3-phosphate acyltransferase [Ruminococcaceae bacterium]|nr:glycerol-3-phosphate acyltransferase [Oscillospiraceae bacterium]